MRIDKLFSSLGILSRSECKKAVKSGAIKINDRTVISSDEQVNPDIDKVYYKGTEIDCSQFVYYILHKPAGFVTANDDPSHKTVFDLVKDKRPDLSAVGRLDKDTTGILLITNDGKLNHMLLSSKYHVPKTYFAHVEGNVSAEGLKMLEEGVDIGDDTPTLPAQAEIIGKWESGDIVSLTLHEGRYHQVKRMLAKVGTPVITLHRESFGPLILPADLAAGEIRKLTKEEIEKLKDAVR